MKIFQLWVVFNSCVFMMIYFMAFLILKYSRIRSVLICMFATVSSVLLELFRICFVFDAVWPKAFVTIANILILQTSALLLAEKKDSYTLFIGFSSSNFVLAGNVAACAVLLVSQSYAAAMAVCTLINAAVFICMDKMVKEICRTVLSREISIWMCLIPAMCYITFYLMLYFPVYFERRPESMFAAASLLATVVVMYILILQYMNTRSREQNLLWRNKELHAYIQGIQLQADTIDAAVQDFRVMRHDMRHKDQLLAELLHNKKYSEAKELLQKDIEYLDKPYFTIYCENVVINSILTGMAKQAEDMGVPLQMFCAVPKKQTIDDFDLAIVTANLIENALQAAVKLPVEERAVSLIIKNREGRQFFMEIQNPCSENIEFSKKTGLPVSRQNGDHGYGMLNIQNFAEKYHAQFDCYMERNTFIVRILIALM